MSEFLQQELYILKIGKAYVYPYAEERITENMDASLMSNKERIEKLQKRFGGTIFQVYIKELEPEEPEEPERSCKNCAHAEFERSESSFYCKGWNSVLTDTTPCRGWKGGRKCQRLTTTPL